MSQQLSALCPQQVKKLIERNLTQWREGDSELSQVTCWLPGGLWMAGLVMILCGRNEKAFQAGRSWPFKPAHGSQGPCEMGVTWSPGSAS